MYEPQEDSIMLSEALKEHLQKKRAKTCLDMGTGTGVQGLAMSNFCDKVICTDINKEAVTYAYNLFKKDSKYKVIESDLFKNLESFQKKFDVIAFNPPYLPKENFEDEDLELTSGTEGMDTTIRFVTEGKKYLNKNGRLFFVVSSLSNTELLHKVLKQQGYKHKVVKQKHFFFEDVMIYEAWL